jgi:hypothetical protein
MPQRRAIWMGGVAVAAAAAGGFLSWRRLQPQAVQGEAETAFWAGAFEGPNGEAVSLADAAPGEGRQLIRARAEWRPSVIERTSPAGPGGRSPRPPQTVARAV